MASKKKNAAPKPKGGTANGMKATTPRKAGPVAKVWEIADKMPSAARKEVLAACEKAGINPHTAKTQFQRWRHRADKQ